MKVRGCCYVKVRLEKVRDCGNGPLALVHQVDPEEVRLSMNQRAKGLCSPREAGIRLSALAFPCPSNSPTPNNIHCLSRTAPWAFMITLLTNLSIQFLTELDLSPIAMQRFSLLIPYRTKWILFKHSLLWALLLHRMTDHMGWILLMQCFLRVGRHFEHLAGIGTTSLMQQ